MNRIKRLTSLAAFTILLMGFTCTALAGQAKVRFDNWPNGGTINHTDTNDGIDVFVVFDNADIGWFNADFSEVSGQIDFSWTETGGKYAHQIKYIYIETDGSDWLWIDQIEVFDGNGVELWQAGINNLAGWCISTDPTDGNDSVCNPDDSTVSKTWWAP